MKVIITKEAHLDPTKVFFMPDGKEDRKKSDPVHLPPPPPPPKLYTHKPDRSLLTMAILAVLMIGFGFGSGFLGFKYWPKLASLIDTSVNSSSTNKSDLGTPKSSAQTPGAVTDWPSYANTAFAYSLNFPDTWYSQNTNNPQAPIVNFASVNPETLTANDIKVSVSALTANGATLQDWVKTNQTEPDIPLTELQIAGHLAYQEKTVSLPLALNTYLQSGEYILIVSYTTSETNFKTYQNIYIQMLDSIKLTMQ